jgi:hypothetical protein
VLMSLCCSACFRNESTEDLAGRQVMTKAGGPEVSTISERVTSTRSPLPVLTSGRTLNHSTIRPTGIHYLLVTSVNHDNSFSHCDLLEVNHIIKVDSCKRKCKYQCQCACVT